MQHVLFDFLHINCVRKQHILSKSAVLYVAANNLGAHSLAGFLESFKVDKFCRFCLASSRDAQQQEVCSGFFQLRDEDSHDRQVQEVREDTALSHT